MIPLLWVEWVYWKWTVVVVCGIIAAGFIQSLMLHKEYVYFSVGNGENLKERLTSYGKLCRKGFTVRRFPDPLVSGSNSLRIAQITDPHVGIHMSPERLHYICSTIAEWNPDFVFITGDLITMESYFEKDKLIYAFQPLSSMQGKVFACLGNHDYESLGEVEGALRECNITLLKDQDAIVTSPCGTIQIIGTEFTWERQKSLRKERIERLLSKFQDKEYFRIWLVHNPDEFDLFPDASVDLMFSGHTHGGQIGLQSLGINFTVFGFITQSPDFGLWQKGNNLMYVHRGTGFQGFPVRLGVSNELSLLTISM